MANMENLSSEKNVSDLWLNNIFESLIRLEEFQRLSEEGCASVLEYIQNLLQSSNVEIDMALIQKKNYNLFIRDFQIILDNAKHLIDKNTFLEMVNRINALNEFEKKHNGFLETKFNQIKGKRWQVLTPAFYIVVGELGKLRSLLVTALWKILSPSARENLEELPR